MAHFTAAGMSDVERPTPMARNAIFRIASQSKALTSVAIMILVEEGRLRLGDSLGRFIPAFARTTVWVDSSDAAGHRWVGRVPAKRGITVRDLLTHTAGISYGEGRLDSLYKAAGYHSWYFADKDEPVGASIERLASLPFARQPGEAWVYGYNTDILGYLVEKVSGMPLDEFIRQRITQPLRMVDTYFYLPKEKTARLAAVYSASNGAIVRAPDPLMGQGDYVTRPRKSFSGGAGMLSTATDYARFLQMLLNGGELDGVRILSPKTVQLMTANHVDTLFQNGRQGFGLGFSVIGDPGRAGIYGSPGAYGWGGAYFSTYWVDPAEHLVVVFHDPATAERWFRPSGQTQDLGLPVDCEVVSEIRGG